MGEPIDSKKLVEMQQAFDVFDEDGDGYVETKNIGSLLRSIGKFVKESDLRDIIGKLNAIKEGVFNFDGFVTAMEHPTEIMSKQNLLLLFEALDPSSSGRINVDTLRSLVTTIGDELTDLEWDEVFSVMPTNADNTVDYKDLVEKLSK